MNVFARKSLRHRISEAMALWPELEAAYPYLVSDLMGQSPIGTVENMPMQIPETPDDPDHSMVAVTFWLRRDDAQTSSDAEDLMDDLMVKLALYVFDELVGGFYQNSLPGYEEISGRVYRFETHFIQAPIVA